MKKKPLIVITALIFTLAILTLGYVSFGFFTTLIFTSGFLGGFILWMIVPTVTSFAPIKVPYWLTLVAFIIHRVEEKVCGFFDALSKMTDVPTPEILSWQIILLVLTSVGAWLLVPILMKRGYQFGQYLAWTFFAAMGITELAHFIFPFFVDGPYQYFPGMASVVILAPLAWWGMWKLSRH